VKVLIVGGGIAGLSLAIALEPLSTDIEVIEREPRWSTVGAAITLRPPAVKAMRRLGVLDDVLAAGRVVDRQLFLTMAGDRFFELAFAAEGEVTVVIHRRKLTELLGERLKRSTVRMGDAPTEIERQGELVSMTLASGAQRQGDLVIGADGIYSWVRRRVFPEAILRPIDQQYWRFCVDGEFVDDWCVVSGTNCFVALIPLPGMTYCAAQLTGSALMDDETDNVRERLLQAFGSLPSPFSDVLDRVTPDNEVHFGSIHEVVLDRWSAGPIGLIGDAAHAFSPVLTLGGGFGMEDAVVLAEELEHRTPTDALAAFTRRQQPRIAIARELANQRIAVMAGRDTIDEAAYQQRLAQLIREDP
jgi:2-polyprenyl-6-methoxyphenol hydroxylase-like FAD-dependent oxidoreductase